MTGNLTDILQTFGACLQSTYNSGESLVLILQNYCPLGCTEWCLEYTTTKVEKQNLDKLCWTSQVSSGTGQKKTITCDCLVVIHIYRPAEPEEYNHVISIAGYFICSVMCALCCPCFKLYLTRSVITALKKNKISQSVCSSNLHRYKSLTTQDCTSTLLICEQDILVVFSCGKGSRLFFKAAAGLRNRDSIC